jgi:heat shock protein HtpX
MYGLGSTGGLEPMTTLLNYTRTLVLLALMTGVFVAMGWAVGGASGMLIAFVMALGMNIYALLRSRDMVLKMHKAEEVTSGQLFDMVAHLARRADLPTPKVFIMHSPQPNAFATGASPSSAAVCASTGLLELLSPEEVAGVMAHELAHIKNRDTLTMSVAATFGGAISMVGQFLQFGALFGRRPSGQVGMLGTLATAIVAPMAASVIQMAISRSREYEADRVGARIAGNPMWLASALAKIQQAVRQGIEMPTAQFHRASAHMFILNPLTGGGTDSLFSTHPSTENRIAALQALAQEMAQEAQQRGEVGPDVWSNESPAPVQIPPRPGRRSITQGGAPWLRR